MLKDEHKWVDNNYVRRDNQFHRRLTSLRNQQLSNMTEKEVLELLKEPTPKITFCAHSLPGQELTDDEVERRALYDQALTQTFNFRHLLRCLRCELKRSVRYKRQLCLLVVAIDKLDKISFEYGMHTTDSAVAAAADAIVRTCRTDVDIVGRYTEDKFIVLCPETPSNGGMVLAERIRKTFAEITVQHQWQIVRVFASIGVASFPCHQDVESLIAQAEVASDVIAERGGDGAFLAPGTLKRA